jgi:REP element-mobilizing transposase RayT
MAHLEHYYTKFEQGKFYHIYNRSIDKKLLFKSSENYEFFLRRWMKYMGGCLDVYAYCLMGNHYHFLVHVRRTETVGSTHDFIAHNLQRLFQSYALAFNHQHARTGSLFQKPYKRVHVDSDEYVSKLIHYIHNNPQKHEVVYDFRNWKWSSYNAILKKNRRIVSPIKVLNWFGGIEEFKLFHLSKTNELDISVFIDLE